MTDLNLTSSWYQHPIFDISYNHDTSFSDLTIHSTFHPQVISTNSNKYSPQFLLQLYENDRLGGSESSENGSDSKFITIGYYPLYQQLYYLDSIQYSYNQWVQKDYSKSTYLINHEQISSIDISLNKLNRTTSAGDSTENETLVTNLLDNGLGDKTDDGSVLLGKGKEIGYSSQSGWSVFFSFQINANSSLTTFTLWKMGDDSNYLEWSYNISEGTFNLSVYKESLLVSSYQLGTKFYLVKGVNYHLTIIYQYQKKFVGSFLQSVITAGRISLYLNASNIYTSYLTYLDQYIVYHIYQDRISPIQYSMGNKGEVVISNLEILDRTLSQKEISEKTHQISITNPTNLAGVELLNLNIDTANISSGWCLEDIYDTHLYPSPLFIKQVNN